LCCIDLICSSEFVVINYDAWGATAAWNRPRHCVPLSIDQYGSVYHTLQQERALHPTTYPQTASPCLQVPRLCYGSVEASDDELDLSWPRALVAQSLSVWSIVATTDANFNKMSKSIIDLRLSRIDNIDTVPEVANVHRPIQQYCTEGRLRIKPVRNVRISMCIAEIFQVVSRSLLHARSGAHTHRDSHHLSLSGHVGTNVAFATIPARPPSAVQRCEQTCMM
jgi:hypothetical protein